MRGATLPRTFHVRTHQFQSTLLMRGATISVRNIAVMLDISIHAPHARSDSYPCFLAPSTNNFNPRSSCEERLLINLLYSDYLRFQSTLLMRGATILCVTTARRLLFQSTLLMRGATRRKRLYRKNKEFQSTLLMRGATTAKALSMSVTENFNPRSSCEERLLTIVPPLMTMIFQSTLLMRGATTEYMP